MIGLIQRVTSACVTVSGKELASIGQGLVVLVGVEQSDGDEQAKKLAEKLVAYRVFSDQAGKMNLGLKEIKGAVLLVPQFTLLADTAKGLRPSFSRAAPPEQGKALFERLTEYLVQQDIAVACGQFGADMQVSLCNDGPVTFWLKV